MNNPAPISFYQIVNAIAPDRTICEASAIADGAIADDSQSYDIELENGEKWYISEWASVSHPQKPSSIELQGTLDALIIGRDQYGAGIDLEDLVPNVGDLLSIPFFQKVLNACITDTTLMNLLLNSIGGVIMSAAFDRKETLFIAMMPWNQLIGYIHANKTAIGILDEDITLLNETAVGLDIPAWFRYNVA